jgi:cytochrome b561
MNYRYDATARALHWLTVVLVFAMLGLGGVMVYLVPDSDPWSHRLFNTHESLGVVVLLVMGARLAYRWGHPPGALPEAVPRVFHHVGHANHVLLYTLLLAQPVIGLLADNADGFQVIWFERVTLPAVIGKNEAVASVLWTLHWVGAVLIVLLITAHIGGALFHAVVRRDGVLRRIL